MYSKKYHLSAPVKKYPDRKNRYWFIPVYFANIIYTITLYNKYKAKHSFTEEYEIKVDTQGHAFFLFIVAAQIAGHKFSSNIGPILSLSADWSIVKYSNQ